MYGSLYNKLIHQHSYYVVHPTTFFIRNISRLGCASPHQGIEEGDNTKVRNAFVGNAMDGDKSHVIPIAMLHVNMTPIFIIAFPMKAFLYFTLFTLYYTLMNTSPA